MRLKYPPSTWGSSCSLLIKSVAVGTLAVTPIYDVVCDRQSEIHPTQAGYHRLVARIIGSDSIDMSRRGERLFEDPDRKCRYGCTRSELIG